MISVEQATEHVMQHSLRIQTTKVPLLKSVGRVLQENIYADRDFPPFDRATMDGIALDSHAFARGQREFPIVAIQAAGVPQKRLDNPGHCLEIMTGAVLPTGADAVIRYEDLHIENGRATVQLDSVTPGQNVHARGFDQAKGSLLLEKGTRIRPAEIATLATVGKDRVTVARTPKIAVVSTGDELVEVSETPLPHQIRKSNIWAIKTLIERYGASCTPFHFVDSRPAIQAGLEQLLQKFDAIVLSGAVSAGKFDYLPEVLASLGVEKHFHKVSQRPGKPFWFGLHQQRGVVVFALPGNPVSTYMCTQRYVMPWLGKSLGLSTAPPEYAVLAADFEFKPDLTLFLPVQLENIDGRLMATPVPGHGSGDLANLNQAQAFIELKKGIDQYVKGSVYPLIYL